MAFLSIGFPGLGLERFSVSRELFSLGSFSLSLYGTLIAVGFIAAVVYCMWRAKDFCISQDEIIDMLICAVPSAVVGARLFYCVFNWTYYSKHLIQILYVWEGGLAVYGSIIGALLGAGIYCRAKRIHVGAMFDLGAMGLLIGQAVGRWGNFFNIEIYGVSTALPWRMAVYQTHSKMFIPPLEVHPLFLYESLWNILGFVLLHFLFRKSRKFNGQVFLCYIAWYGLGRGFMEGLRAPEYILDMFGDAIAVNQLLAFVSAAAALLALGYLLIFRSHDPENLTAWTAARDAHLESKGKAAGGGGEPELSGDSLVDIDPDDYTPRPLDRPDEPDEKPDDVPAEEDGDGDPA